MAKRKNGNKQYLQLENPFVGLPVPTILSKELNALSPHSRWLYVVILTRFNREKTKVNNEYKFTYADLAEITRYDGRRLSACISELKEGGFIYVVPGGKHNPSRYTPVQKWLW